MIGPELGVTQPGMTIVCGDSHTSTHGAFGALAFGIGTSEVEHVLATQTLQQRKPRSMRIAYSGELPPGVTAKDLILATIGRIGVDGGVGHVIEYSGPADPGPLDGGPDDRLQHDHRGRRPRRHGRARRHHLRVGGGPRRARPSTSRPPWRTGAACRATRAPSSTPRCPSTPAAISPQVSWGTNPAMVVDVTAAVPEPQQRRRPPRARVHGARGRHADPGHPARPRLRGLLHQLADRRPARGRRDREGTQGRRLGRRDGRARLRAR